ncbi:MAG: hypothetical protein RLZZ450_3097 [Pseudomonadota bacterium]|jgi:hypothetical protein
MVRQIVDLRGDVPVRCGDATTLLHYLDRVAILRKSLAPGRFAIAPDQQVSRTRRGTLCDGAEVTAADLLDELDTDGEVVERGLLRFNRLLAAGVIVEAL